MEQSLTFGFGNAKLSKSVATFSLPAGYSCPFAKECFSRANKLSGKIIDGEHCRFRCFAASQESLYPSVRKSRWKNFAIITTLLKHSVESLINQIQASLPKGVVAVRIHVSGDYFSEKYFLAWLNVAYNNPATLFYGYTKATPYIVKYRKYFPNNFRLIASKGGTHDHLIYKHNLKFAEVVYSPAEANARGLQIDHNDNLAMSASEQSFALLIHGSQPENSRASRAVSALRKRRIWGYGKHSVNVPVESKLFITLRNGKIYLPLVRKSDTSVKIHHA